MKRKCFPISNREAFLRSILYDYIVGLFLVCDPDALIYCQLSICKGFVNVKRHSSFVFLFGDQTMLIDDACQGCGLCLFLEMDVIKLWQWGFLIYFYTSLKNKAWLALICYFKIVWLPFPKSKQSFIYTYGNIYKTMIHQKSWSNGSFCVNILLDLISRSYKHDIWQDTQTFCPFCEVEQSLRQEHLNNSFVVLSDLCIRMPKYEHVTLCQFGNWIKCNWTHYHTVIHPCHCSVIKVTAQPIVCDFINPVFIKALCELLFLQHLTEKDSGFCIWVTGCTPVVYAPLNPTIPAVSLQLCSPWRLKCFLAHVERRAMYVCEYVWVSIRNVLSFHYEMETACVWD